MANSSPTTPETKMNGASGASVRASSSASTPLKSGSEKSDRIRSNPPACSAWA